jgi:protocatechuate 4,5-dioxygenase alpha chain
MSSTGYWLHQFCLSLRDAGNRARFLADERAYLDGWPMTEAQKTAVLARDFEECQRLGGKPHFLAKLGHYDDPPARAHNKETP